MISPDLEGESMRCRREAITAARLVQRLVRPRGEDDRVEEPASIEGLIQPPRRHAFRPRPAGWFSRSASDSGFEKGDEKEAFMDAREVTHVSRNEDGTILAIGNPGQKWSPRSKDDAARDIDRGLHRYFVRRGDAVVDIDVVHTGGKYLRTGPDATVLDNLANLPDLFVDEFVVGSGELFVSDPCWERKIANRIKKAKNGVWRATVENIPDGRALMAACEDEVPFGEPEEIEVGVDSCQAGIFCGSVFPSPKEPNPDFYETCCDASLKSPASAGIIMKRGVVASTGDDGCYNGFVWRNKDGYAVAVRIEF
jgi:hypothetical protein